MFVVNAPTGKGRFGSMCVTAVDFSLMFCCSNRCQCLDVIQMYPTFSDFLHALLTLAWRPRFERSQRHEGKKKSFRGFIFHVFLYFYLTNRIKKTRKLTWLNGCSILLYVFEVLAANYVNRGKICDVYLICIV